MRAIFCRRSYCGPNQGQEALCSLAPAQLRNHGKGTLSSCVCYRQIPVLPSWGKGHSLFRPCCFEVPFDQKGCEPKTHPLGLSRVHVPFDLLISDFLTR